MVRGIRIALLPLLAASLLLAPPATAADESSEWPIAEFPEPSGIVWHPLRKSLFVVGDQGDIGEVSAEGKLLRQFHLGGDLEAVSVDPKSGNLFVVRESHEIILEMRPDTFKLLRRFTIDRSWKGNPDFLRRGGDGIEGLTYVADDKHPEGGAIWVVNQFDPPVLLELAIPMKSSKEKFLSAKIARVIPVDSAPLSEVTWVPETRKFLIVSALWKRVAVYDEDGRFERSVRIPGFMPEGITRLPDGRYVIAQDSGGLVLWDGEGLAGDGAAMGPPAPGVVQGRAAAAGPGADGAAPIGDGKGELTPATAEH